MSLKAMLRLLENYPSYDVFMSCLAVVSGLDITLTKHGWDVENYDELYCVLEDVIALLGTVIITND